MKKNPILNNVVLNLLVFLILSITISCNKNHYKYTKQRVKEIDRIEFEEVMVELLTDSTGSTLDTLMTIAMKKNKAGELVFERVISKEQSQRNYLLSDGTLFYQTIEMDSANINTLLNGKLNKNGLLMETSFVYANSKTDERDTMKSVYQYLFDENNKKKNLKISTLIKGKKGIEYIVFNSQEKPISEVRVRNLDTTEIKKYYYQSSGVLEKVVTNYPNFINNIDLETIRYYYPNEELKLFEKYECLGKDNKALLSKIDYELNEDLKMGKSIHHYIFEERKEYRIYIYHKSN